MESDFYDSPEWRGVAAAARERDDSRCTVARLIGGRCHPVLHAHHLFAREERPDLALDLDNVVTVCARHHPKLERLRRELRRVRGWRRCPHLHPTRVGRRDCERRLNRARALA